VRAYAQVTVAISDDCPGGLEGFSTFDARFAPEVFEAAAEDGPGWSDPRSRFSVMLDLMNNTEDRVDEKLISVEQAARLLDLAPEVVVPLARQRLAQINDTFAAYCAAAGVSLRSRPSE
jgi:hypothetical protein